VRGGGREREKTLAGRFEWGRKGGGGGCGPGTNTLKAKGWTVKNGKAKMEGVCSNGGRGGVGSSLLKTKKEREKRLKDQKTTREGGKEKREIQKP